MTRRADGRLPRVLFLNQYFPPDEAATAQMLGDLVAAAAKAGVECRVVTSDRYYAEPGRRVNAPPEFAGARVARVRTTGFGRGTRLGRVADYATFLAGLSLRAVAGRR